MYNRRTTSKRKAIKDAQEIQSLHQEFSNLQESVISNAKWYISNLVALLLCAALVQTKWPKGLEFYEESMTLYENMTLTSNGRALSKEIRTILDDKTEQMNKIAIDLTSMRYFDDTDYEKAKRLVLLGHDCLQLPKRLKSGKINRCPKTSLGKFERKCLSIYPFIFPRKTCLIFSFSLHGIYNLDLVAPNVSHFHFPEKSSLKLLPKI